MTTQNSTIGTRIRECRKKMGYSQEKLSEILYLTKTTVSRYERDEYDISARMIADMSKVLNTTPNYLLLGNDSEEDKSDEIIRIISGIKDPALRKLAVKQLECIADMEKRTAQLQEWS